MLKERPKNGFESVVIDFLKKLVPFPYFFLKQILPQLILYEYEKYNIDKKTKANYSE